MTTTSSDLTVLGAGPAGLAAAWQAAKRGLSVTVLERAERVGGLARSFDVAGVRVDHGSHRLHPATPPPVLAMLRDLLGDDLQTRPRNGRLRVYERWIGFPLKAPELARAVPLPSAARIARDVLTQPLRRSRAGDSYACALSASLGPELYDAMYEPYARKLWGLPGEQIDVEQARVRVTADTPWKVAARVLRKQGNGQGRVFHYPRRGFGQIPDSLATAGVDAGVDLRCGAEVTGLRLSDETARVTTADGAVHETGRVFSTVPLPVLARLTTSPEPPREAVENAAALRFRAMVLVYLVHEGGRWSPFDAHYLPGGDTPVTRISEPANYRVSAEDPADRSVLCAEIPCTAGDSTWTAPDEELAGVVEETLATTRLPPVRRAAVTVRRLPHVYPVYERGFLDRLAGLETWASALPRLTTFGRLGLFAHDNTHHALVMAHEAVQALQDDGRWDAAAWSAARDRFRSHVVED